MTSKQEKLIENYVRRTVKRFLTEEVDPFDTSKPFAVVMQGGSIGSGKSKYLVKGLPIVETFATIEEAKEYAVRRNKSLSPGEKSYYRMKYIATPITSRNVYTRPDEE